MYANILESCIDEVHNATNKIRSIANEKVITEHQQKALMALTALIDIAIMQCEYMCNDQGVRQ